MIAYFFSIRCLRSFWLPVAWARAREPFYTGNSQILFAFCFFNLLLLLALWEPSHLDLQILNIFYARSGRGPLTTFDSILIANAWLLWIFSTHFCQSLEFAHFFVRFSIHCLCFLFNSLLSSQLIFHSQQTNMDCQQSNVHALVNLIRLVLFVSETRFSWMMFFLLCRRIYISLCLFLTRLSSLTQNITTHYNKKQNMHLNWLAGPTPEYNKSN